MSVSKSEKRRAPRIRTNIPTSIENVGQVAAQLHPNLAAVYERVSPSSDNIGERFPGIVSDLSTNGAFISGPALPLLSRVAFTFALDGFGQIEVLAWTLWRRTSDCSVPTSDDTTVELKAGFGVLFEAVQLDARQAIAKLIAKSHK